MVSLGAGSTAVHALVFELARLRTLVRNRIREEHRDTGRAHTPLSEPRQHMRQLENLGYAVTLAPTSDQCE
jgi:hypothetical protein